MSVGLLAVPFQYGLYVFGHLSKWFVFVLMFKFWSVYRLWNGRPTIGYNTCIYATQDIKYLLIINGLMVRISKYSLRVSKVALFQYPVWFTFTYVYLRFLMINDGSELQHF